MTEILVAIIGGLSLIGAAFATNRLQSKLTQASDTAETNTARTEKLSSTLWDIIDGLRGDVKRLNAEVVRVSAERDKLQAALNKAGDTE